MKRLVLLLLLVSVEAGPLLSAPALARNCSLPANYYPNVRPDPEGVQTILNVGILVADVTSIDDVGQTLEGDFILRKSWRDPRLADLVGCRVHRSEVWFPVTDILNSSDLRRSRGEFSADQVLIGAGGVVEYYQRFFGSVATYHSLEDFPFDHHRMRIRIAALGLPIDRVRIDLDRGFTGLAKLLNIPDWSIEGIDPHVVEDRIPEFNSTYSIIHLDILASRNSQYYIWKVMLPLILIVMMSFIVFWISPERFGPQVGLAATSMLTLIAFQFATTNMLPKLSYFTLMDQLILGSTILVFGTLVESTIAAVLVTRGRTEIALRIDQVCRWLFPAALLVLWAVVLS